LSYDELTMALYQARAQLLILQTTQGPPGKAGKSKTSWWRR
jgi:hypothetical protein